MRSATDEMSSYVPLWCKSNYSFLEGASHPEELVEQAHALGLSAIAITDRDGVYGVVRAHSRAKALGIKLIIGSQLTLDDQSQLVLLAQNRSGYGQLCQLISTGRLRSPKGQSVLHWPELFEHTSDLILLVGDPKAFPHLASLKAAFGDRLYLMIARHHHATERQQEAGFREQASQHRLPTVAVNEVLYHSPARQSLQDVLTCIRHGTNVFKIGHKTNPNHEHSLKSPVGFEQMFADDLLSLDRSREIAARCHFSLADLRYRYPSEALPDGRTSFQHLRRLSFEGGKERYGQDIPEAVIAQLEKELRVIDELEYSGYFLSMHDIVQFCAAQNILCQGRGSAANSVVCYCLKITAVDPIRMNLLFERFISKERAEPPDIDLDIEHCRREEVIQHVYKKYGRSHAAMVATVIRYRNKSALRDVGKAMGVNAAAIERMAKLAGHHGGFDTRVLQQAGLDPDRPDLQKFLTISQEIIDFPRHLSIHPGGFLLGHEPISTIVPIENGSMENRSVIQWDKDDIETLKLFKVDLLGLGALNVVHRTFDFIMQQHGRALSLATIPAGDQKTYDMICKADTVGVFQIESRAQMSMLPRLKPRNYYDLVIEISLVRPGPITGGMVHPYLRRRSGEEAVEYPHPSLIPVLKKTLGIPLFQEQVMRLAVVAADYTPGEADQLRRDMAAWRSAGRIERHRQCLIGRMKAKGIEEAFAARVFEQIRGFGEYGFPESHAASFALIAYATAWLKRYYPTEFLCALLNAQPMGFYSPATLIDDAKRHQVSILPIDVRYSDWDCHIGNSGLRMGLRYIQGLRPERAKDIVRIQGLFSTLEEFRKQSQLDKQSLNLLGESGALEGLVSDRRETLWQLRDHGQVSLPITKQSRAQFDTLTEFERIQWDYQSSHHSARGHPLQGLRPTLKAQGYLDAQSILQRRGNSRIKYAGLVICRQRPGTAGGVTFMTMEDETGFVNLVLWKNVFERFSVLAKTASFLAVSGQLQFESNVVHLIAEKLWRPRPLEDPPTLKSRDFA
jgi:error-prone DNA polymerase